MSELWRRACGLSRAQALWTLVVMLTAGACTPGALDEPPSNTALADNPFASAFGEGAGAPQVVWKELKVVSANPRGEFGGATDLFVRFNQPMVALESLDAQQAKELLQIVPAVEGRHRWVDPSTLRFEPSKPLQEATEYTVTIPAGTTSAVGGSLGEAYRFTFVTQRPEVRLVTTEPDTQRLTEGASWALLFNHPIELGEAAGKVRIVASSRDGKGEKAIIPVEVVRLREQTAKEKKDGAAPPLGARPDSWPADQSLYIKPKGKLPLNSRLVLTVDPIRGTRGAMPMGEAWTWNGMTYGPLRFEGGGNPEMWYGAAHWMRFSNPLAKGSERFVSVTPRPPKGAGAHPITGNSTTLLVAGPWVPEQSYTMTIAAGVTDIFGQKLTAPIVVPFKVAPIEPEVYIDQTEGTLEANGHRTVYGTYVSLPDVEWKLGRLEADQIVPWMKHLEALEWGDDPFVGGLKPQVAEKRWSTGGRKNARATRALPLDLLLKGKEPGLVVGAAGYRRDRKQTWARVQYQVTDIGLAVHHADNKMIVWVGSLGSGSPVNEAAIEIRNDANEVLWTGDTGKQGIAVAPGLDALGDKAMKARPLHVFARVGKDLAFVTLQNGDVVSVWETNYPSGNSYPKVGLDGLVYSDRGLYRAGETVELRGVVRLDDFAHVVPVDTKVYGKVAVGIYDGRGEPVVEGREVALSRFGTFNLELPLARTASLGTWQVNATLQGTGPAGGMTVGGTFQVEAFRTPEFEVGVAASKAAFMPGDTLEATASADYLFGAPMRDAKVEWRIESRSGSFAPPSLEDEKENQRLARFSWSDFTWERPYSFGVGSGEGQTDAGGKLVLSGPTRAPSAQGPRQVTFVANVTDVNRQQISGSTTALQHGSTVYVGIRTDKSLSEIKKDVTVEVVAVQIEGAPAVGVKADVEFLRREWLFEKIKEDDDPRAKGRPSFRWQWRQVDTPVGSCHVVTARAEQTCTVTPDKAGYYIVRATAKDKAGNLTRSAATFYAWGGAARWGEQAGVELIFDKPMYKVGETATVLIKSPLPTANGVLIISRGGVLEHRALHLSSNAEAVKVPIKPGYGPNVHVLVALAGGRTTSKLDAEERDTGVPRFLGAEGNVSVEVLDKQLTVTVAVDKPEARPGDTLTVDLDVRDVDGKPVAAEVALAAVDKGILNLINYRHPDLFSRFWHERPSMVAVTALHGSVIPIPAPPKVAVEEVVPAPDAAPMAQKVMLMEAAVMGKGGGGMRSRDALMPRKAPPGAKKDGREEGGDGGSGITVRSDFRATAHWSPAVMTNAEGHARLTFKLPDNLTTWMLMAVAATAGDQFGGAQTEMKVNKKLLLRPSLPRFANPGDRFDATVVVQNETTADQKVEVSLTLPGDGATVAFASSEAGAKAMKKTVSVPAGKPVEVAFPVVTARPGAATFLFTAVMPEHDDAVQGVIPVITPVTTEAVAAYGDTTEAMAYPVVPPGEVRDDVGGLEVAFSSTALSGLDEGLRYLIDYPYGCIEQTVSRAFPLLAMGDLVAAFKMDLGAEGTPEAIRELVKVAVTRVLEMQRYDGGFGYWPGADHSHPYASVYAMHFLGEAMRHDVEVPEEALESGREYLVECLASSPYGDSEEGLLQTLALQAYAVFVLSQSETELPEGTLKRLYDARAKMPLFARAFLLMASVDSPLDNTVQDQLQELINNAVETAGDAHFEEPVSAGLVELWSTDHRTDAIVLMALLKVGGDQPLVGKVVRWLMKARKKGRWSNTQENIWALLTLERYFRARESETPDFEARAWLQDTSLLGARFKGRTMDVQRFEVPMADLLAAGKKQGGLLTVAKRGPGRLYYTLRLQYAPTGATVAAQSEGFAIDRRYELVDKPGALAATKEGDLTLPAGEYVRVRLTVTVPERRHYVVVDDPLPAGMEAVNLAFATSDAGLGDKRTSTHARRGAWWQDWSDPFDHKELKDDRVLLFADQMEAGVYVYEYMARTTTRGNFFLPPAKVEEMYAPETFGRTAASKVVVD